MTYWHVSMAHRPIIIYRFSWPAAVAPVELAILFLFMQCGCFAWLILVNLVQLETSPKLASHCAGAIARAGQESGWRRDVLHENFGLESAIAQAARDPLQTSSRGRTAVDQVVKSHLNSARVMACAQAQSFGG